MPLISGLKVGDVLHGTRNLRRWLRAASVAVHLAECMGNGSRPSAKKMLLPNRGDEYVVAAHNDRVLIVWSKGREVFIPFINPGQATQGEPVRMDGKIFSQWFVRTDNKLLNLRSWPAWAQAIRLSYHLSAGAGFGLDLSPRHEPIDILRPVTWRFRQVFGKCRGYEGPAPVMGYSPVNLRAAHRLPLSSPFAPTHTGSGPLLSEIPILEAAVPKLSANLEAYFARRASPVREVTRAPRGEPWVEPGFFRWQEEKVPLRPRKKRVKVDTLPKPLPPLWKRDLDDRAALVKYCQKLHKQNNNQ